MSIDQLVDPKSSWAADSASQKKMDWSKQQWWQDADFKKPMKGRHVCLAPGVDQQEWGEYGRILSKAWLVQNDNIHYLNDQKLRFSWLEFWSIRILACLDCPSKMMTWGTLSSQSDSFLTKQVLTRKREAGPRVINHPAEVCQNKIIPYYPAKKQNCSVDFECHTLQNSSIFGQNLTLPSTLGHLGPKW